MSMKESASPSVDGKASLERMTELGRKVFAVKKAALPKTKTKKRKKH
jgi:hypothetical protein